jgi:hypothetical protein
MTCPHCGATNPDGMRFCGKCGLALDAAASNAPGDDQHGMDGADALAYAGEKTSLWSRDTLSGYSMSKRALEELEADGRGDSESADIARRGITIAKAKWIISAIVFVIGLIVLLAIWSSHSHNNGPYGLAHPPTAYALLSAASWMP